MKQLSKIKSCRSLFLTYCDVIVGCAVIVENRIIVIIAGEP